ncbi:hypothetical protein [Pontibacter anaerobius]|uniref:DUF2845 domain-containing protein n=1 Tax=Pontibacter anaerobius TaxID=2993940 RepID=A0ABT3RGE9_9BACT|nr:hypothetical protein [Pontibacter anaerobius]MCX2740894.1 hypothetical protein [Pontibacter anaerobius]
MKIVITLLLTFLMTACALVRNTVDIGMTESEFKKKNVGVYLSEKTAEHTVYRLPQSDDRDLYVFFEKGKLIRVQESIYRPDIVIEKRLD